jgi:hypothetical protein
MRTVEYLDAEGMEIALVHGLGNDYPVMEVLVPTTLIG